MPPPSLSDPNARKALLYSLPVLAWVSAFCASSLCPRLLRLVSMCFPVLPNTESNNSCSSSSSGIRHINMWTGGIGAFIVAAIDFYKSVSGVVRNVVGGTSRGGDAAAAAASIGVGAHARRGVSALSQLITAFTSLWFHPNASSLLSTLVSYLFILSLGDARFPRDAAVDLVAAVMVSTFVNYRILRSNPLLASLSWRIPPYMRGAAAKGDGAASTEWLAYLSPPVLITLTWLAASLMTGRIANISVQSQQTAGGPVALHVTESGGARRTQEIVLPSLPANNQSANALDTSPTTGNGAAGAIPTSYPTEVATPPAMDTAGPAPDATSQVSPSGTFASIASVVSSATSRAAAAAAGTASLSSPVAAATMLAHVCGGRGLPYALSGFRLCYRGDVDQLEGPVWQMWTRTIIVWLATVGLVNPATVAPVIAASSSSSAAAAASNADVDAARSPTSTSSIAAAMASASLLRILVPPGTTTPEFSCTLESVIDLQSYILFFCGGAAAGLLLHMRPCVLKYLARVPGISHLIVAVHPPSIDIPGDLIDAVMTDIGTIRVYHKDKDTGELSTTLYTDLHVPNECFCPITRTIMSDPVLTADGFSYDREAIEEWLRYHSTSPMTNLPLASESLKVNWEVRKLVEEAVREYEAFEQRGHCLSL